MLERILDIVALLGQLGIIISALILVIRMKVIYQHLHHIYDLCDILSSGPHKKLYDKIRLHGLKPLTKEELYKISRSLFLEDYKQAKEHLIKAKEEASSPEELEILEKKEKLLEESTMLLETLGPDTPIEHADRIMQELVNTFHRYTDE